VNDPQPRRIPSLGPFLYLFIHLPCHASENARWNC
jgi:hypothetical protein